ncbi:hypothetical protein JXA85_07045 [Candidatus Woesearchaeota archaeon]|nr:hypothetical protein [Candidatus Woesearchaeota archaeon]
MAKETKLSDELAHLTTTANMVTTYVKSLMGQINELEKTAKAFSCEQYVEKYVREMRKTLKFLYNEEQTEKSLDGDIRRRLLFLQDKWTEAFG